MLSTDEFKTFASEYVMFCHITTRLEGRAHDGLLSDKGFTGFPSLAAMNADGDIIAKLTGGRDVAGFREMMASAAKYEEIRAKAEHSPADKLFLLLHSLDMGNVDVEAARKSAAELEGLDDGQRREIEGKLTDLEIMAVLGKPKSREEAEELARQAGGKFAAMWAKGREPTSDEAYQPFFILMMDHAETNKDVDLFERALARMRERFGESDEAQRFFTSADERLATLKAGAGDEREAEGDAEPDEGEEDGG